MASPSSSLSKTVRIGLVGGGTVGGGVYELIMGRLNNPKTSTNANCTITKICVRDVNKPRDFTIDETQTILTSNIRDILDDSSIDMVVELMGGTTLAKSVVLESLHNGKSVVTANKALVAECLDEIDEVVKRTGSKFAFEASVCGGIPIIHTLQQCYSGDIIHEISGIMNGTTNYMLCKMEHGADYDQVLKEAQELGYAEADPTADVEGHDVRAKIAILAKLAFGKTVPVNSIPCTGISQLGAVDFEYAKLLGCTIKLIGTAKRLSNFGEYDGPLSVSVSPRVLPRAHLLSSMIGSGNAVAVTSANLGNASYTGPGAGRAPTASSVVADIYRILTHTSPSRPFLLQSDMDIDNDYWSEFYIRINFTDSLGIIRCVGELAEKHFISINSVLQNPIVDRANADFVITTEACKHSQALAFCRDIAKEDFARSNPVCMPLNVEYP